MVIHGHSTIWIGCWINPANSIYSIYQVYIQKAYPANSALPPPGPTQSRFLDLNAPGIPIFPINSAHNNYLLSRGVVGDYADLNLTIYRSIYQSILSPSLHDLHGKSTSKSKSVLLFPSLTNICFHPSSEKRPCRKPHFFLSRKAMRYNRRDGCWKLSGWWIQYDPIQTAKNTHAGEPVPTS